MPATRVKIAKNVSEWTANTTWWADLITSDEAAAREFYGPMMGWDFTTNPIPEGGSYTMIARDGVDVAGLMGKGHQMQDTPTTWGIYISVPDVKAAVARVTEAGGAVIAGPMDVADAGRMAAVADPQGATFNLWEQREHGGAGAVNSPGAITWTEVGTTDVDDAKRFYGAVFGWTFEAMGGEGEYWLIQRDGAMIGGLTGVGTPGSAGTGEPHWNLCLGIEDADAAGAFAAAHGGAITFGPMDSPYGRLVGIRDPQGATVSLLGLAGQNPVSSAN